MYGNMAGIVATSATSTTSFATTTSTFDDSLVVAPLLLPEEVHTIWSSVTLTIKHAGC